MAVELGEVVVLAYADGIGTGPKLVHALDPPTGDWKRITYPLDLSGVVAGGVDADMSGGEVVNFVDAKGVTQVSLIAIQQVSTSTCAQVAHSVFDFILSKAPTQSPSFTLLLPSVTALPGSSQNLLRSSNSMLLARFFNGASGSAMAELPTLPGTTKISEDFLAMLLHFVHLMGLPTILLLGPKSQGPPRSKDETLQIIFQIGKTVAQYSGIAFSEQKARDCPETVPAYTDTSDSAELRTLYI